MAMRLSVGVWLVVLCLSRVVVFGQVESDPIVVSPTEGTEVVGESIGVDARASEAVPEPEFVVEGRRIWQEAIAVEIKKLGEKDAEFEQRIRSELAKVEPMYRENRAAYEARARRESLGNGLNYFAPRRQANRQADQAGLMYLAGTVDHLREQLAILAEKHANEAVPIAWEKLSEDDRQKVIRARALSPGEKIELGVDDEPLPPTRPHFVNSLGINMIKIPTGSFTVENVSKDLKRKISISNAFWMSEMEVTREQFAAVVDLGEQKPSSEPHEVEHDPKSPVLVSWYDAVRFCIELSKQASEKGESRFYRLPTEAEWEYSCRAGTTTDYHFGNRRDVEEKMSNYMFVPGYTNEVNYDRGNAKLKAGGFYRPNDFGLYDMHGNAAEWTGSWWVEDYLDTCPSVNPVGPDIAVSPAEVNGQSPRNPYFDGKVVRGSVGMAQTGDSTAFKPDFWSKHGIRLVCEVGEASEIARNQYREFHEGETYGRPAAYEKALRDAIEIYRVRWDELHSEELSQNADERLIEMRKMPGRAKHAADLASCLARIYAQLNQPEMAERAYKAVAHQRQEFLDRAYPTCDYQSYDCTDNYVQLVRDYIKIKDYQKAKQVVVKVLEETPQFMLMRSLKEEIDVLEMKD